MEHESFKTWLWVNKSRPVGYLTNDEILRYADEYARGKAGLTAARIAELEKALADVHDKHWFLSESIEGRTISAQFKVTPPHPLLVKE